MNAAERDNAVKNLGYVEDEIVAYVHGGLCRAKATFTIALRPNKCLWSISQYGCLRQCE
ncbi:hypothetical protein C8Q80DRAFT_1176653 [Daedaleopsis nitida]|nr:hypothetical protein C8Q80DRAFT_1176653 [Daedaleopsis nitida]